jgi:cytochrome oxidase Cu insertion factor (SCO1/SenC/PrrC family)
MNHAHALLLAALLPVAARGSDLKRSTEHNYDAPAPGTYGLPVIKAAADGDVLDANGKSRRLADLTRGRVTVLSFIYTRCASARACPYATGVLRDLHRLSIDDAALGSNMRLVSMSFDPGHDTPSQMTAYAALAQTSKPAAEWHFVTTASREKLTPILEAYGQAVDRKQNPADPTGPLNHTLRVFIIDAQGRIRNIYNSSTLDVRLVLADVQTLVMETEHQGVAGVASR